ncbi:hypothetical protein PENSPDRAFT_241360 [Peniophora sp. CONT]|nr:hypothetical protein PENSPDRAFT_241360 [Peniophora sp. CONT]
MPTSTLRISRRELQTPRKFGFLSTPFATISFAYALPGLTLRTLALALYGYLADGALLHELVQGATAVYLPLIRDAQHGPPTKPSRPFAKLEHAEQTQRWTF